MTRRRVWGAVLVLFTVVLLSANGVPRFNHPLAAAESIPTGDIGEFVAFCDFSHRLSDDPIVFPGEAGRSHSHDFFGSTETDADTIVETLLTSASTCDPIADRSAYWVPTFYDGDGAPIPVEHGTFYYLVHVDDPTTVQPYPLGLKVIAGNARAAGPDEASHIKWSCLGAAVSSTEAIVQCPAGLRLELLINFPDCWNGRDLDSADHKSHMAYSAGGACPDSHPVPVAALQFKLRYATEGGSNFTLASGPGYTAHGDFFNAWEADALDNRLNCLHNLVKCGPEGFQGEESTPPQKRYFYLPLLEGNS